MIKATEEGIYTRGSRGSKIKTLLTEKGTSDV